MLMKAISSFELARLFKELGYDVRVRDDGSIEAYYGPRRIRARLDLDNKRLSLESNDYGPECLRDLRELVEELERKGHMPRMLIIKSPYVISYEKKRGATRRILKKAGIESEEEYQGYCG